jgi:putative MATE family efflux protein
LLAGGHGPVASAAETWFRIAVLGVPGILLVLAGNGWMRGVQDTRRPVRIVLLANALSAVASPILVYPLGLGLAGSAVANVSAQAVAGLLFVRAARSERRRWRPQWTVLRGQLAVGRELMLREAGFQAAFLTAAAVAARMGTAQVAAHQIGLELWEFTALLLDSFAIAAQSLVGAALGGAAMSAIPAAPPGRWHGTGCSPGSRSALCWRPAGGSSRPRSRPPPRCSTKPTCCGRTSSACSQRPASSSPWTVYSSGPAMSASCER